MFGSRMLYCTVRFTSIEKWLLLIFRYTAVRELANVCYKLFVLLLICSILLNSSDFMVYFGSISSEVSTAGGFVFWEFLKFPEKIL